MKKLCFMIVIYFVLINNIYALNEENELEQLKQNIQQISEKISLLDKNRLERTYPIGSIYITTVYSDVSQVEQNIGGKWEKYSSGRALFGLDRDNTSFNEVNKVGGSSNSTLSEDNLPSHTHEIPELKGSTNEIGAHTHTRGTMNITGYFSTRSYVGSNHDTILGAGGAFSNSVVEWPGSHDMLSATGISPAYYNVVNLNASDNWTGETSSNGSHTHNVTTIANTSGSVGSATPFTNLPPYITVYMYKRIG